MPPPDALAESDDGQSNRIHGHFLAEQKSSAVPHRRDRDDSTSSAAAVRGPRQRKIRRCLHSVGLRLQRVDRGAVVARPRIGPRAAPCPEGPPHPWCSPEHGTALGRPGTGNALHFSISVHIGVRRHASDLLLCLRTNQLQRRQGRVSYEAQKANLPPSTADKAARSASAAG